MESSFCKYNRTRTFFNEKKTQNNTNSNAIEDSSLLARVMMILLKMRQKLLITRFGENAILYLKLYIYSNQ